MCSSFVCGFCRNIAKSLFLLCICSDSGYQYGGYLPNMNTSGAQHASMANDGSSGYGATYGTANIMQVKACLHGHCNTIAFWKWSTGCNYNTLWRHFISDDACSTTSACYTIFSSCVSLCMRVFDYVCRRPTVHVYVRACCLLFTILICSWRVPVCDSLLCRPYHPSGTSNVD